MENRSCLICTVPITVTIFGVEACRACTSFFKRTVIAGRTFTCRQGDRQCEIRKHEKYMCRCCRYDRCVNLGMYYALPPKKKPRKQRALTTTGEEAKAPPIVELPSPSTSSPSSTAPVNDSDAVDSEGCEISLLPEVSLIDLMEDEYKASYERRLILEKEYVASRNLPRFDHPTEEFYIANFTALYELFRIAINDSTGLLQNVIDDFEEFPIDHRVALFKNFVTKFSMIEWVYYSTRIFPDSTSMFMASLITCADARKMDEWMEDGVKCVKNEAFRTTVQGYSCNYMDMFGSMAKMGELTEREFYALAILNYCDIDTLLHLPDEIITSVQAIRAKVFRELQDYYRNELKLHDFSERLGNLMMLAHGAGETGALMSEEMQMYAAMFDVYSDDKLFREIFSK